MACFLKRGASLFVDIKRKRYAIAKIVILMQETFKKKGVEMAVNIFCRIQ